MYGYVRACVWPDLVWWVVAATAVGAFAVASVVRRSKIGRRIFEQLFRILQAPNRNLDSQLFKGNYAPVKGELHVQNLSSEIGALPSDIAGCYLRTGSNPQFQPDGGYIWFDGDAMIHSILFADSRASYCNRFVNTFRYATEKRAGHNIFARTGDLVGKRGILLGFLDRVVRQYIIGPKAPPFENGPGGNTSLVYHNGQVLALNETSKATSIEIGRDGILRTKSTFDFDGKWRHAFTAHPKKDPCTGELVFFGYNLFKKPYVNVCFANADGEVTRKVPLDLPNALVMHDFGLTKKYAVFLDHNLIVDYKVMLHKDCSPIRMDPAKQARIGLLDRSTPNAPVKWFNVDSFFAFHVAAAWDDVQPCGDEYVHIVVGRYQDFEWEMVNGGISQCTLSRFSLHVTSGTSTLTPLVPSLSSELPTINSLWAMRPARYTYAAVLHKGHALKIEGVVKVDMWAPNAESALVSTLRFPAGSYGGEACFAPRAGGADQSSASGAEDDGYLVTFVTDETQLVSYCMVFDARSMSDVPVAKIELPQRVPYGFHGTFLSLDELQQHWKAIDVAVDSKSVF